MKASPFLNPAIQKKIAEAQTELALCYLRIGEYDNAADLLKLALAQLPTDNDLKAKAILRSGIVKRHASPLNEAFAFLLDHLLDHATLFQKINSEMLKGCYHQTLGDVLKDLWESKGPGDYLDRALSNTLPQVITLNKPSTDGISPMLRTTSGFYTSRSTTAKKRTSTWIALVASLPASKTGLH